MAETTATDSAAQDNRVKTYSDSPRMPALRLPENACDSHVHVFGPTRQFPYAAGLKVIPQEAPKEALFALHRRMGISRCVVVQSMMHGMDNSAVEDTIAAGGGNYLGVALVPIHVPKAELQRLARAGFRAVRFNFMQHLAGAHSIEDVIALTHALADLGMHLQVHFESALVHSLGPALLRSATPVVIDHMGRVDARLGEQHEDFQALMRLLDDPKVNVKVSGIDRIEATAHAGSGYPLGVKLAHALVKHFPAQCVWGLDWPHPNHTHIPDDGELVDALAAIAPTPELLQGLLVSNPQALYRF